MVYAITNNMIIIDPKRSSACIYCKHSMTLMKSDDIHPIPAFVAKFAIHSNHSILWVSTGFNLIAHPRIAQYFFQRCQCSTWCPTCGWAIRSIQRMHILISSVSPEIGMSTDQLNGTSPTRRKLILKAVRGSKSSFCVFYVLRTS